MGYLTSIGLSTLGLLCGFRLKGSRLPNWKLIMSEFTNNPSRKPESKSESDPAASRTNTSGQAEGNSSQKHSEAKEKGAKEKEAKGLLQEGAVLPPPSPRDTGLRGNATETQLDKKVVSDSPPTPGLSIAFDNNSGGKTGNSGENKPPGDRSPPDEKPDLRTAIVPTLANKQELRKVTPPD